MTEKYREVRLEIQDRADPEKWNTIHRYKHENALVASGSWTHKKLIDHAKDQLDAWGRSAFFGNRKMRVFEEPI